MVHMYVHVYSYVVLACTVSKCQRVPSSLSLEAKGHKGQAQMVYTLSKGIYVVKQQSCFLAQLQAAALGGSRHDR